MQKNRLNMYKQKHKQQYLHKENKEKQKTEINSN